MAGVISRRPIVVKTHLFFYMKHTLACSLTAKRSPHACLYETINYLSHSIFSARCFSLRRSKQMALSNPSRNNSVFHFNEYIFNLNKTVAPEPTQLYTHIKQNLNRFEDNLLLQTQSFARNQQLHETIMQMYYQNFIVAWWYYEFHEKIVLWFKIIWQYIKENVFCCCQST